MTKWFHDFSIGWNWWYYIGAVIVLWMLWLGFNNLSFSKGKFVTENSKLWKKTIFPAIVITPMIIVESQAGLLQHFLNGLSTYEWAGAADFQWAFCIIGILPAMILIFISAQRVGEYIFIGLCRTLMFFRNLFRKIVAFIRHPFKRTKKSKKPNTNSSRRPSTR